MLLITGGSGFVGAHLCAYAALRGKGPVRVLARLPERVFAGADETLVTAFKVSERMADAGVIGNAEREAVRERMHRGPDLLRDAVEPIPVDIGDRAGLRQALSGVDTVIHAVAIIRETGGASFSSTNIEGTRNVVDAMGEAGVRRLVSLGVLGTAPDERRSYSRSRSESGSLVANSGLAWTLVEPSLVLGYNDAFSRRAVRALDFSKPIVVLPNGGRTRFQPLWIGDLVRVLAACVEDDSTIGRTYELGGPETVTFAELLRRFSRTLGKRRIFVSVPSRLLVPGAAVMGRLFQDPPVTPTELGELDHDNVTNEDSIEREFGFRPMAPEDYLGDYLPLMAR